MSESQMSSAERKAEYRDLLDQIENIHENEDIGLVVTQQISAILLRVNSLFKDANIKEQIKHTDEVLLDAKVIATASDVLLNVTEAIDCALDAYDASDFARRIRTKLMTDEPEDDSESCSLNLLNATHTYFKKAPNFCPFYGPIGDPNVEPKPVKAREVKIKTSKKREEQATKKAPEKITHAAKEEDSVDDTVKFLQWTLSEEFVENGGAPLNYFVFVTDPKCFTTTVENMFHLSFLVRDGRVKVSVDNEDRLTISPVSNSDAKKAKKGEVNYKQTIFSIDIDEWTDLIEAFNIRNCFLDKWKKLWEQRKSDLN